MSTEADKLIAYISQVPKQKIQTRRLVSRRADQLTPGEIKQCRRLNYGRDGEMHGRLQSLLAGAPGEALLIRGLDDRIVAWALVFLRDDRQYGAYFYVPGKYRRQGLGRRLAAAVRRRHPQAHVHPWNKASDQFFSHFPSFVQH